MKNVNKALLFLAAGVFASCADDGVADYPVDPGFLAQQQAKEYLNSYDALKSYIGEGKINPNFKLGAGVDAKDFSDKGGSYLVTKSNFTEMTPGNAMKYGSVVSKDGSMDFSTVERFVDAAAAEGMTVFGHAIAWHSQQQVKYLSSLLADKEIPGAGPSTVYSVEMDFDNGEVIGGWGNGADHTRANVEVDGKKCMKFSNAKAVNFWEAQSAIDMDFEPNVEYTLSMSVKSNAEGVLRSGFQNPADNYASAGDFPNITLTSDWQDVSVKTTSKEGATRFLFSYGDINGDIFIDDLKIFYTKQGGGGSVDVEVVETEERTCFQVKSQDKVSEAWDTQAWFLFPGIEFKAGDSYEMTMEVRAAKAGKATSQIHKNAGEYLHWAAVGDVNFTTDWEKFTSSGTIPTEAEGGFSIALNLNEVAEANSYFFDKISFKLNGVELVKNGDCDPTKENVNFWSKEAPASGGSLATLVDKITFTTIKSANSIPQTPEEKKDTLTWAMTNWIKGMMNATNGKVVAWDVVNEAIGGGAKNAEGFYELQHANSPDDNGVRNEEDGGQSFLWQDIMGDIDYVRVAVDTTRKYFKGKPEDLKLFINDYNLESWWDGNLKAKSLVYWIGKWEANGTTKIDGIGTQMHVSYKMNAKDQEAQEKSIVEMFKILAASGKLVKISELDMGIQDEKGKAIMTADVTNEQSKKMSNFYKFIIKAYFENVPKAQQYGITQWCITDSPANSSWRKGEPVGLWTTGYTRKDAYAGFCEGLQEATK